MHINKPEPEKASAGESRAADLHVQCYAGYRAEETPRRFREGSGWIEVIEILSRWQTPDARFFKIRCNDGNVYLLNHDGRRWTLE